MPIPALALMGGGALLNLFGSHSKQKAADKAAKDQARLNNEQRAAQMAAQGKILSGLQAGGWNPFGVNALGSSSSGTSNTSGSSDTYSKENPFTTPEYGKLDELVRNVMTDRLSRGSSLPPGYEANAIRRINEASAGGAAAASNAAARHGLSGAQVFGLNAPIQTARAGQIADLRGNVPLLERQMMNEDIGIEGNRQAQFGTGHERRGHETSRSTTNSSQSGTHQTGPDIGALSSLLMPPGAQQSTLSPNSFAGDAFSALGQGALTYGATRASQPKPAAPVYTSGGAWNSPAPPPTFGCPPNNPFCR